VRSPKAQTGLWSTPEPDRCRIERGEKTEQEELLATHLDIANLKNASDRQRSL